MTREEALSKAIMTLIYFQEHFCKSKEAVDNTQAIIDTLEQIEQEPKWIPVLERLPDVVVGEYDIRCSEDVLVYDGADLRVGYFVRIEKFDCCYWNIYGDDCFEPIAWMPLPEPYKAEREE